MEYGLLHLYLVIAVYYTLYTDVTNLHDIHRFCNNCNDKGSIYANKLCHNMFCNEHIEDAVVVSLVVSLVVWHTHKLDT